MDEKRFKYIVDEHGASKDEHVVELIKYTKQLHEENAKLKKENPGFFKRIGDQFVSMFEPFSGEGKFVTFLVITVVGIFAVFVLGAMSISGLNAAYGVYEKSRESQFMGYYLWGSKTTILGKEEDCTYIVTNWKHGKNERATGCIKDPKEAILLMHTLSNPIDVTIKEVPPSVSP